MKPETGAGELAVLPDRPWTADPADLDELASLLRSRGDERYTGEPVSHLSHALQCAGLAQAAGAVPALVVAALLHDVGHLVSGLGGTPSARGIDDGHESRGAVLLARWFGPAVCEPVRLHVAAKRCLARRVTYRRLLSEDSLRSLWLQGGPMDDAEADAFCARPQARAAMQLRIWDDSAKRLDARLPSFNAVWELVRSEARAR